MAELLTQQLDRTLSNRKVWLVNGWHKPFTQEFRGEQVTVPGKGRILMSFTEANRFKALMNPFFCPPDDILPNGDYPEGKMPKMLHIQELTEEEREEIEGKNSEDLEKEREKYEKALKRTCPMCEHTFPTAKGLKLHTARMHPDAIPVEDDDDAGSSTGLSQKST